MAVIGKISVGLAAKTAKFNKGMSQAGKRVKRFESTVKRASRKLRSFATMFGPAITGAAMIGFAKRMIATTDALGKTADMLGMTSENLSRLRYGAKLSGIEVRALDMGLQRMTRRVAEAAKGTGEAKDAIRELGLDARRLVQLSPYKMLERIADRMAMVRNSADRVRLAMKLFDSEGVAMVRMLREGSAGLQRFARESNRVGATITGRMTRAAAEINDTWTRLAESAKSWGREIALGLRPAISAAENAVRKYAAFKKSIRETGEKRQIPSQDLALAMARQYRQSYLKGGMTKKAYEEKLLAIEAMERRGGPAGHTKHLRAGTSLLDRFPKIGMILKGTQAGLKLMATKLPALMQHIDRAGAQRDQQAWIARTVAKNRALDAAQAAGRARRDAFLNLIGGAAGAERNRLESLRGRRTAGDTFRQVQFERTAIGSDVWKRRDEQRVKDSAAIDKLDEVITLLRQIRGGVPALAM